ncbi:MBL fold metallo-hydrolase [Melissospora conviva]|uniref:MBL fold metallo-hydrolase n=1 Tax=Melissospora conviva TaxID=3388432 RepID=UPI003B78E794
MTGHVTTPAAALADRLPDWVTLLRAPNPGPMTLEGTNTWVLRAEPGAPALIIDPGPDDAGHLARIAAHTPVGGVLITHGHGDHTEGIDTLAGLLGGAPVRAVDAAYCRDAEPITAATRLAGHGLDITPVAVPGHTADSVAYLVRRGDEQVILTGDTILGRGTTVVAYPDGNLGAYLESLELLGAYQGITALPGHGPALADCAVAAGFYLAHRRARLDQVRAALAAGISTAPEVVAHIYADVDPSLWPAATWSVRAQLAYLAQRREFDPGAGGLDLP